MTVSLLPPQPNPTVTPHTGIYPSNNSIPQATINLISTDNTTLNQNIMILSDNANNNNSRIAGIPPPPRQPPPPPPLTIYYK